MSSPYSRLIKQITRAKNSDEELADFIRQKRAEREETQRAADEREQEDVAAAREAAEAEALRVEAEAEDGARSEVLDLLNQRNQPDNPNMPQEMRDFRRQLIDEMIQERAAPLNMRLPERQPAPPQRMEDGMYQDEEGNLFVLQNGQLEPAQRQPVQQQQALHVSPIGSEEDYLTGIAKMDMAHALFGDFSGPGRSVVGDAPSFHMSQEQLVAAIGQEKTDAYIAKVGRYAADRDLIKSAPVRLVDLSPNNPRNKDIAIVIDEDIPLGQMRVTHTTNNIVHVNSIGVAGGPGTLGMKAIRETKSTLQEMFPSAYGISGFRVSGIRQGAAGEGSNDTMIFFSSEHKARYNAAQEAQQNDMLERLRQRTEDSNTVDTRGLWPRNGNDASEEVERMLEEYERAQGPIPDELQYDPDVDIQLQRTSVRTYLTRSYPLEEGYALDVPTMRREMQNVLENDGVNESGIRLLEEAGISDPQSVVRVFIETPYYTPEQGLTAAAEYFMGFNNMRWPYRGVSNAEMAENVDEHMDYLIMLEDIATSDNPSDLRLFYNTISQEQMDVEPIVRGVMARNLTDNWSDFQPTIAQMFPELQEPNDIHEWMASASDWDIQRVAGAARAVIRRLQRLEMDRRFRQELREYTQEGPDSEPSSR